MPGPRLNTMPEAKVKGSSVDDHRAIYYDQAENTNSGGTQYRTSPICHLMALPIELFTLIASQLKKDKSNITALSLTCSTLHAWTLPLLYEEVVVRVHPEQPLCFPPRLGNKSKKKRRLTAGSELEHDQIGCRSDVHKLLHSRFELVAYVRKLRVACASPELASWVSYNQALSNEAQARSARSTRGTRQESVISLNIAFLVERMPRLAELSWDVDSYMGETLQLRLSKSAVSTIEVGLRQAPFRSQREEQLAVFLHQNHPVATRMPALCSLGHEYIVNSLQLRQIGVFIGLHPYLKKLALGLHYNYREEIVPNGPEAIGVLIRAIVETQRSAPYVPASIKYCPYSFSLRELRLSYFTLDVDAEKGLSFLLCHCPLETLVMREVAMIGHLSTFFRSWRRSEALSCLRHLIFETDCFGEHAMDFVALTRFLSHLGRIPHKLQSLDLLGGWRLLNMENANIEEVKSSTILDGLRSLIWESCLATWCTDCESARATRREMSIFIDMASGCRNITILGLPGLFIGPVFSVSEPTDTTANLLTRLPLMPHLRHLHVQQTDRFQHEWSALAMLSSLEAPPDIPSEQTAYFIKRSPGLTASLDDYQFRFVARVVSIFSLMGFSDVKEWRTREFFSVSFGVMKYQVLVWRSQWVKVLSSKGTSPEIDYASFDDLKTIKALPGAEWKRRVGAISLTPTP